MKRLLPILLCALLGACDRLGLPDPAKQAEAVEAEGRAIGGACRHAGRALEDCYNLHPKASKAAVFAGWREMNDYMTENKIEVVKPELPPPSMEKPKNAPEAEAHEDTASEEEVVDEAAPEPAPRRARH